MLIQNITCDMGALADKVVVITGGGGGIATEAGLALAYMGAKVIVGEVDEQKGKQTQELIAASFPGHAFYFPLDLADAQSVACFCDEVDRRFGTPYAILNNATVTPLDAVADLPLEAWDISYLVHLRGPLQLIKYFLPKMEEQNGGVIVFTPSSGAAPYMGGYEVFKTAQAELANTLAAELENTGISVFCVAPGLVKTHTAMEGIEKIAPLMGITTDEFFERNKAHFVSPEEAGTAFAVSLLFAQKYNGREIGGVQVLADAGALPKGEAAEAAANHYNEEAHALLIGIVKTFDEQHTGWKERNMFERQWMLRDFKKHAGCSADEMAGELHRYLDFYGRKNTAKLAGLPDTLAHLHTYYRHQLEMMLGYIQDPKTLEEYDTVISGWIQDVEKMKALA